MIFRKLKFSLYKNSNPLRVRINNFGGGEESRTPVHYTFHINFSECSLLYLFIKLTQANVLKLNIALLYPLLPKHLIDLFPTNITPLFYA